MKMKKLVLGAVLINLLGCYGCKTEGNNLQSIVSDGMELVIEQGEYWLGRMKVFIFSIKKNPQLAAWIEDDNGNYLYTIVVSEKSAKGNWISAPKEGRPEALPVWDHKCRNNLATDNLDVVSSATIKGSFETGINKGALVDGDTYNVYLEINHSFDYNDYWTKDNSGVNGQPSLIYHGQFIAGLSGRISLVPVGHGSVDGSDGNITSGLENFTTALSIVKNAYVDVK